MREIDNYLMHYGVKGMKWGVRKAIEDDGSLSRVGKERSYTDDESKAMFKNERLRDGEIKEATKFLGKQYSVCAKDYAKYEDSMHSDLKKMASDEQFINSVKQELYKKFGEDVDPYNNDAAWHTISDRIVGNVSKETKSSYDKFDQDVVTFFDNMDNIVNDVVGKYGNEKVKTSMFTKVKYKDIVDGTIYGMSEFNDPDERYAYHRAMVKQYHYKDHDLYASMINWGDYDSGSDVRGKIEQSIYQDQKRKR